MDIETWQDIPGWVGYQASDRGQVRVLRKSGQWYVLHHRSDKDGYQRVDLRRDGSRVTVGVHQLVAMTFLGEPPADSEVCHQDGNRAHNTPGNLRYDTHAENMKDIRIHRRQRWNENMTLVQTPGQFARVAEYRRLRVESDEARSAAIGTWALPLTEIMDRMTY